ncbi:MAG TPA: 2-phosphosulfolactate phosphatase [Sphingobium sp.]
MTIVKSEWGLQGIEALRPEVSVLVIVDVLSFSTAVDIATGRGASVLPFPTGDRKAAQVAAQSADAVLAAPRRAGGGQVSLSPRTLSNLTAGTRIVLPSPNGSRLSLHGGSIPIIAGCLRNAQAVALLALELADGGSIGVIPAGERWPDGSLRPAIEDLLGAGAIIHALDGIASAEALVARDSFRSAANELDTIVRASVSGQELITGGFAEDVELALEVGVSTNAPLLINGAYVCFPKQTVSAPARR